MSEWGEHHRPVTAERMALAIVRAATAMGELSQLRYRYEAVLRGHCVLRARWIALAALLAMHPGIEPQHLSLPLGCGPAPLQVLARVRLASWWDEALVIRLVIDLEEAEAGEVDQVVEPVGELLSEILKSQSGRAAA